jgi:hypothetical protein
MGHLFVLLVRCFAGNGRGRRLDLGRRVPALPPPPTVDDLEGWDRLREKRQRAYVEALIG